MSNSKSLMAGVILAVAGLSGAPAAQAADDSGWYVGAGVGQSHATKTTSWAQNADANQALNGFTSSTLIEARKNSWKLFVGYQFNANFAVEGGYTDFGRFHGVSTITAPAATSTTGKWDASSPINASVVGIWPIRQQLAVFGKLGLAYTKLTAEVAGPMTFKLNANRTQPLLGVGLKYDFTKTFGVRGELERFNNVGDGSITGQSPMNMFSLSAQFRF